MDKSGARNLDFGPFGAGPSRDPERGEGHGEPKLSFSYQALHGIVLGKSEDRNIDFGPFGARPSGVRLSAVRLSAVRLSGARRSGAKGSGLKRCGVKRSGVTSSGVTRSGLRRSWEAFSLGRCAQRVLKCENTPGGRAFVLPEPHSGA